MLLAAVALAGDWNTEFREAESAFNGRTHRSCIPLFQQLIAEMDGASKTRELTAPEVDLLSRSLDYLGQAYFNFNQQDQARATLLQLIQVNPDYVLNEDLVSSKFIDLYAKLKTENLAHLEIAVTPPEASVKLDGKPVAAARLAALPVLKGDHEIEASRAGYLVLKKTVTVNAGETASLRIALAPDPARRQVVEQALKRLQSYDALGAQESMERALAQDPTNTLARTALAEALLLLGCDQTARAEGRQIAAQVATLDPSDAWLARGVAGETTGDCAGAAALYAQYLAGHSDSTDTAVRLARAQLCSGNNRGAIETLRGQRFKGASDPRLDLLEAEASEALGDYQDQKDLAAAALSGAKALNAPQLALRARLLEGRALAHLDDEAGARRAFQEVLSLPEGERDSYARALAHISLGEILLSRKENATAEKEFLLAQDLLRTMGNEKILAAAQEGVRKASGPAESPVTTGAPKTPKSAPTMDAHNRIVMLLQSGFEALNRKDYAGSESAYREALRMAQQAGDSGSEINALNSLGFVSSRQGDDAKARDLWQQALDRSLQANDKAGQALSLYNLSTAEYNLGHLDKANDLYEESAARYKEIGQTPRPRPW